MKGILGKKVGMMSYFDEKGKSIACTVIKAGPCVVTQVKTEETDGYSAVQIAFDDKKDKNTTNALKGHFAKSKATPKKRVVEIRGFDDKGLGDEITVNDFWKGETVDVIGTSKGKGFQGVVKRHKFRGVGMATHGQHNRLRAPGSIGAGSDPSRVFKGMRMAGRMGGDRVKVKGVKILEVLEEKGLILIKGTVPGANNSYVLIEMNHDSMVPRPVVEEPKVEIEEAVVENTAPPVEEKAPVVEEKAEAPKEEAKVEEPKVEEKPAEEKAEDAGTEEKTEE